MFRLFTCQRPDCSVRLFMARTPAISNCAGSIPDTLNAQHIETGNSEGKLTTDFLKGRYSIFRSSWRGIVVPR